MDSVIAIALNQLASSSTILTQVDVLLAERAIFLVPLVLATLWLWPGRSQANRRRAVVAGILAGLLALAIVVALDLTHPLYRARPFTILPVTPLFSHKADSSFPSDHTLIAIAAFGPLLFHRPRLGAWAVLGALVIGFARVAGGVHFPTDILGSALMALLLSAIAVPGASVLIDRVDILRDAVTGRASYRVSS